MRPSYAALACASAEYPALLENFQEVFLARIESGRIALADWTRSNSGIALSFTESCRAQIGSCTPSWLSAYAAMDDTKRITAYIQFQNRLGLPEIYNQRIVLMEAM